MFSGKPKAIIKGDVQRGPTDQEISRLFETIKEKEKGSVSLKKLCDRLENQGLSIENDRRLKAIQDMIASDLKENCKVVMKLDLETFSGLFRKSITSQLLLAALRNEMAITNFGDFKLTIKMLYEVCKANKRGSVCTLIPELDKKDPNLWGLSIISIHGQRCIFGDSTVPFTLLGIGTSFLHAWTLEQIGDRTVNQYMDAFYKVANWFSYNVDHQKKPYNAMLYAGGLMLCALLQTKAYAHLSNSELFEESLKFYKKLSGGYDLTFNNSISLSHKSINGRDRALTWFLISRNAFPPNTNPLKVLDFFDYMLCMEATCESLSGIVATLANDGVSPFTGERVISKYNSKLVLSKMLTTGMNRYTGSFSFKIGLPCTASMSGGVCIVVPGLMGAALFSPNLNDSFFSLRAMHFLTGLLRRYGLHPYDGITRSGSGPICKNENLCNYNNNKEGSEQNNSSLDVENADICTIMRFASEGDTIGLAILMASGYPMYKTDYFGTTALHMAAARGHVTTVSFLVSNCYYLVEKPDLMGMTPLDYAGNFNQEEVEDFLSKMTIVSGSRDEESRSESSVKKSEKSMKVFEDPSERFIFQSTGPMLALSKSKESRFK